MTRRAIALAAFGLAAGWMMLGSARPASAQAVGLPQIRLTSVFPPGGKQGTAVEVTVAGNDFEDVTGLYFDHAGLKAEPVMQPPPAPPKDKKDAKPPAPQPIPGRFKVTIAPDAPLGAHDVRAVGRFGVSNPHAFVVSNYNEAQEAEPNNDPGKATRVELNATVNGRIDGGTDIDYFVFSAKKDQRVVIDCSAWRIDSELDGTMALYTATGKELAFNRDHNGLDPLIDFTAPADGDYYVKLYDLIYGGGPSYVYRVSISTLPYIDYVMPAAVVAGSPASLTVFGRNLAGGVAAPDVKVSGRPLEKLQVTLPVPADPVREQQLAYSSFVSPPGSTLDGFEYRIAAPAGSSNPALLSYAAAPVVLEAEPNDTRQKPQDVAVPADISGQFGRRGDTDFYRFAAKQGQVFWIEAFCERIGSHGDPYMLVQRVTKDAKGIEGYQDIQELDDDTANLGQVRYPTNTADVAFRFQAPADGQYLVMLRDRFHRGDPRYVYRLAIRNERPDFRLVLLPFDENLQGSLTVRQGGTHYLDVVAFRRDGFSGEITVAAEGLPKGVTCPPVVLGAGVSQLQLVFKAADDAPVTASAIRVVGSATINGQKVTREARGGGMVWPQGNRPGISRMNRSIVLAVREGAPYFLKTSPEAIEVAPGLPMKVKLELTRRGDYKAAMQVTALSLPPTVANKTLDIAADKREAEFELPVPANASLGNFTLVLRGDTQVPYNKDPKAKEKPNVRVIDPALPVSVTIVRPLELSTSAPAGTLGKGAKLEITAETKRRGGFAGPVQLQFVQLPAGVQSPAVTLAPDQKQGKLVLEAAANAAAGNFTNVLLRGTIEVNKQKVTIDQPFTLTVK